MAGLTAKVLPWLRGLLAFVIAICILGQLFINFVNETDWCGH